MRGEGCRRRGEIGQGRRRIRAQHVAAQAIQHHYHHAARPERHCKPTDVLFTALHIEPMGDSRMTERRSFVVRGRSPVFSADKPAETSG